MKSDSFKFGADFALGVDSNNRHVEFYKVSSQFIITEELVVCGSACQAETPPCRYDNSEQLCIFTFMKTTCRAAAEPP